MKQIQMTSSTTAGPVSPLLTGALELADWGLRVFPLHHPDAFGECSCGSKDCTSIGKHPRISAWQKEASDDPRTINRWWKKWPKANIGVATGNGLIVVDIDSPEGEQHAQELGLPPTSYVKTARGRHLYYYGDGSNRRGVRPGIDIRGDGGYVVAPPSVHANGHEYQWVVPLGVAFVDAPEWATAPEKADRATRNAKPAKSVFDEDRPTLAEGERNDGLFRLGSSLRGVGLSQGEIAATLVVANKERCIKPLKRDEVNAIATSVCRFPPGRRIDATLLSLTLGPYATTVYLAIRTSCDHENKCFRSYHGLAEQTNMGRSSVIKAVKVLREAGLIHREHRPCIQVEDGLRNQSNTYTLLDPADKAGTDDTPDQGKIVEGPSAATA